MNSGVANDMLPVVEDFYSIQGEGFYTGRAAYFVRLGGCDVCCEWCDAKESWRRTDHPLLSLDQIVERVKSSGAECVVITGGEPTLHNLNGLTQRLHHEGLELLLESSGGHEIDGIFDWICISPKRRKPPIDSSLARANELKVVVGCQADLEWAEEWAKKVSPHCKLFLQPEWGEATQAMALIVEYIKANPQWRVSLQTHKFLNIP